MTQTPRHHQLCIPVKASRQPPEAMVMVSASLRPRGCVCGQNGELSSRPLRTGLGPPPGEHRVLCSLMTRDGRPATTPQPSFPQTEPAAQTSSHLTAASCDGTMATAKLSLICTDKNQRWVKSGRGGWKGVAGGIPAPEVTELVSPWLLRL